ncbi:RluA family pseudouridine synthase [bacterium]|nr:RluA family pseudouridine synthase [bacterium]RQV97951.1 MAG: RluA family pseudouridine synthase [bacterium]
MESQILTILIPSNKAKERIDTFLTRELPRFSRSQIQAMVKEELIRVDGKSVKSNYSIRPGDSVTVALPRSKPSDLMPEDIPLDIVFEDEYLIIINKPPGMVVHPAHGHRSGTLVNALLYHCDQLSKVNEAPRPGIVHRLDKDTSGLLLAVKDDYTHRMLANQFSEKQVDRMYKAIVWKPMRKRTGTVETLLNRSTRDRKVFAVASSGKRAVTHYEADELFDFLSLISLHLETGRTHQIRVHMAHIGHPVFGDQTYGGRSRPMGGLNHERTALARHLLDLMPRQALHAMTLGFVHPVTKENLSFTSHLPEDMQRVLSELRKSKD